MYICMQKPRLPPMSVVVVAIGILTTHGDTAAARWCEKKLLRVRDFEHATA